MIITTVISIISSIYFLPAVLRFLESNHMITKNYNNRFVYNPAGIFFSIHILLISTIVYIIYKSIGYNEYEIHIIPLIIGVLSSSMAGYIDDNSKDISKGIIGHGKMILKGELTGGSIKAFTGILTSLLVSYIMFDGYNILLNSLLISLMQNFINLMDLRPGRAVKVYIAISLILMPLVYLNMPYFTINLAVIVSLLFYLPHEFREVCMMGDTGSNVLGIVIGIIASSVESMYFRIILLFILVTAQVYAEKKSINKLIENNVILNYIDMWGRKINLDDKNKKGNS